MATIVADSRVSGRLDLDHLSHMACRDLDALYRQGSTPRNLNQLDGAPTARLLSARAVSETPVAPLLRWLAASPLFPWSGKHFHGGRRSGGEGSNLIRVGRQWTCLSFESRLSTSWLDGGDCIELDYRQRSPWWARRFRDELRELAPDLYLGATLLRWRRGQSLVLFWFALDTRSGR